MDDAEVPWTSDRWDSTLRSSKQGLTKSNVPNGLTKTCVNFLGRGQLKRENKKRESKAFWGLPDIEATPNVTHMFVGFWDPEPSGFGQGSASLHLLVWIGWRWSGFPFTLKKQKIPSNPNHRSLRTGRPATNTHSWAFRGPIQKGALDKRGTPPLKLTPYSSTPV